jgi:eukaryotic-like serine/threonine-protein kinase
MAAPTPGNPAPRRYRAFISYSHQDARIAAWLHKSLENYRVPTRLRGSDGEHGQLPERLSPIFRDRDDLSSAGAVGPRIAAALADADALVVICSPDSARSPWVNEEILTFKRSGRAQRIYALIVAGEPHAGDERECFPAALRFELEPDGRLGTIPTEPLAADLRDGKDGKALARLKLLSGLLGVDLDVLRRRDTARRQRRLLAITTLAVAVMLVTSALAVQAVIAQRAAERRQKQAEALVEFMLGDLNDKLSEVSRLDILEAVDDKAMEYFQSLPITDVTDQTLEQRAKAFEKIGTVRMEQGHLAKAIEAFQAAAAISGGLARADSTSLERQLAYANTLAYVGKAHWYLGELDAARTSFETAEGVLRRAKALSPDDPRMLFQLATLNNNNGHVLEARGQFEAAIKQYRSMREASEKLVALDAGKVSWQTQLGLAHNNLAKMALLEGDLAAAVAGYRADVAIETALAKNNPSDNAQAEKRLLAKGALGRTLALAGDRDGGIAALRDALSDAERLRKIEPDSTSYQEDVALYSYQLARLLRRKGDLSGAQPLTEQAITILLAMTRRDHANAAWQRELAEARIEQAELSRAAGRDEEANYRVQAALSVLEAQLAEHPEDRTLVLAATEARLLAAALSKDPAMASNLRRRALASVDAQVSGPGDPRLRELHRAALRANGRRVSPPPVSEAARPDRQASRRK